VKYHLRVNPWSLVGAGLLQLACESDDGPVVPADYGTARPPPSWSARPLDRLAPGELAPGTAQAFGLVLPRVLRIEAQFPREVFASGQAAPEAVTNYVRTRVTVTRVEIGAARTVFPACIIKGGPPDRRFQIEVVPVGGGRTKLVIRDVTPVPGPEGLSVEERWKRAGMTPEGRVLDWQQQELK
jgi:hypothetical protein